MSARRFPARRSFPPAGGPIVLRARSRLVRRCGITLVEVLLALGLLLVISSITWPAIERTWQSQQLRRGAEQVRLDLMSARLRAVETGLAYQFRCEPQGGKYVFLPFEQVVVESGGSASESAAPPVRSGELPEGLVFSVAAEGGGSSPLSADALRDLPDASRLAAIAWSPPILFLPDGSALDSSFLIQDAKGRAFAVTVRGLTGGTSFSHVEGEASR